jgi:hypothetical protein
MKRAVIALALLLPLTAHAVFDLDPRIRSRPDGRFVLPAPFDGQDAAVKVGTLGECSDGYLFCDPSLDCPSDVQVGQTLKISNPLRLEEPGAAGFSPVRLSLMSGGECYGQDMQELYFPFIDFDGLDAPPIDCVSCMFAIWMSLTAQIPECPEACGSDFFAALICGFLDDIGPLGAAPATPSFLGTLRALRDQIMATSAAGQRYTQLHTTHSPALMRVVPSRPWLVWMVGDALGAWLPALNALVTGQGAGVTITQSMMDDWLAILAEFQSGAPAETAAVIQEELDRLDLPSFVGLNMDEARARFEVRGVDAPAGCGDGFGGADCALAELLATDVCGAESPDAKLAAALQKRVGKARETLARAATSTRPGKTRKLVRTTAKQLAALQKKVRKAKATADACRTTLDAMTETRRRQVIALGA